MRPTALSFDSAQALDLAELYRRQRAFVRASLLQCGVPATHCEDAIHDVFVVVHRRLDDYDAERGSMRAWLFGISLRIARAHRRALGRTCAIPEQLMADGAVADPELYVSHVRAAEAATKILETLPRDQWAVLMMADVEGMTAPEIAQTLGVKVNTVYTRLMRARTKVRRKAEHRGAKRWLASAWLGLGKAFRPPPLLATAAFVSMRTLRIVLVVSAAVLVLAAVAMLGREGPESPEVAEASAGAGRGGPSGATANSRRGAASGEGPAFAGGGSSVAGTVRTKAGGALSDAMVCAWRETDVMPDTGRAQPRCAKGTRDGHYRIERLVAGARYRVTATAPKHAPAQYVGADGNPHVRLAPGETRRGVDIAVPDGGVLVQGMVVDVIGGPIEGASVALLDAGFGDGWSTRWGERPPAMVRTDAEGHFSAWVARGGIDIDAFAAGYAPARLSTNAPGPTVTVALAPESILAGTVVGPDGASVAGAEVRLDGWDDRGFGAVRSGPGGGFRVAGLAPGRYRLTASVPGMSGRSTTSRLLGVGETITDVTIEMRHVAQVIARVEVEGTHAPCTRGAVGLLGPERTLAATVDAEGLAHFDAVPPSTYGVVVACEGLAEKSYPRLVVGDDPLEPVFEVSAGVVVRGRVVDSKGEPVADAWVAAYGTSAGATAFPHRAQSGADGAFELQGLGAGAHNLDAVAPVGARSAPTSVEIGPRGLDDVKLELPAVGVLEGTVSTDVGDPVGGAYVRLPNEANRRTQTADDGTFRFDSVSAGAGAVVAQRDADDRSPPTKFVITPGQTTTQDVVLEARGGRITGLLLDEDGSPVGDAVVVSGREGGDSAGSAGVVLAKLRASSRWWQGRPTVLTDTDGRFTLDALAAGKHTVLAFRRGGGDAWSSNVPVGADVKLELPHATKLEGTVRTADGAAPKTMLVDVRGVDNGLRVTEAFAAASGSWAFEDLDPGTYEVKVTCAEGLASARADVEPERGAKLSMTLSPGIELEGMFVDLETGEPVPNVFAIAGPGNVDISELAAKADRSVMARDDGLRSDGRGRFVIPDARPGSMRMLAMPAELVTAQHAIVFGVMEIEPGTTTLKPFALPPRRVAADAKPGDVGFALANADTPFCTDARVVASVTHAQGLAAEDVIVSVDGHDVDERRCYLVAPLLQVPAGTTVELGLADDRTVVVKAR